MHERLDQTLLAELEVLMRDDFAALLDAYLQDSEHQLHEASDAWEQGDLERLRQSAHSLKGSSGNVGALVLADLCADLESLAARGDGERVAIVLDRVRDELREVRDAVTAVQQIH